MTWVRIDDGFADHPKVLALGPLAIAAQIRALCYCSRQLTNGFLPVKTSEQIMADLAPLTQSDMVKQKLWQTASGGYRIHDYLKYNPSRTDVLKLRATRRESGRQGGLAKAQADAKAHADRVGIASGMPPSPTPRRRKEVPKKTRYDDEVALATRSNGRVPIAPALQTTIERIQAAHPELTDPTTP